MRKRREVGIRGLRGTIIDRRLIQEMGGLVVPVATPVQTDWVKHVLFDLGYLARIKGDAIKIYLVILEGSGGQPDKSVTMSLNEMMKRTRLSCPTVIESLSRLEELGLVVSTTRRRGKVKTYYVADPPAPVETSP